MINWLACFLGYLRSWIPAVSPNLLLAKESTYRHLRNIPNTRVLHIYTQKKNSTNTTTTTNFTSQIMKGNTHTHKFASTIITLATTITTTAAIWKFIRVWGFSGRKDQLLKVERKAEFFQE